MNTDITKSTDLELAQMQGTIYQQLMQAQQNLLILNQELEKRSKKEPAKKE